MRTRIRVVRFCTGKVGARFFDFNPFSFGWWYLHKSKSGQTVGITRNTYYTAEGIQFEGCVEASKARFTYISRQQSKLKIIKKY